MAEAIGARKQIGLVAHDHKKADLLEWVTWNRTILVEHDLIATGTTGRLLEERLGGRRPIINLALKQRIKLSVVIAASYMAQFVRNYIVNAFFGGLNQFRIKNYFATAKETPPSPAHFSNLEFWLIIIIKTFQNFPIFPCKYFFCFFRIPIF
jgi:hypothetical protein